MQIQKETGKLPLVLHGGTGIPEDMIKKAIDYVLKYKNTPEMWLVKNEKVNFDNFAKILLIATQKI